MATNRNTFIRNVNGDTQPYMIPGLFQNGNTQAIKRGEILKLSGGNWIPLDADQSMAGVITVAGEEIKDGDRAGYYRIIVPRPGDIFEYALATAGANNVATDLYYSDSETVTTTTGSNVLGNVVGTEHYPEYQGHLADDASGDAGTTVKSDSYVRMHFTLAASYYVALIK